MESLTYNVTERDHLNEMLKQIKQLEGVVKEMIPSHFGIIVRPYSSTTTTATQVKHKYHRYRVLNSLKSSSYSSLPVARKLGRPKTKRQRTRVKYVLDVRFYNLLLYMNYYNITYSLSYLCFHMVLYVGDQTRKQCTNACYSS